MTKHDANAYSPLMMFMMVYMTQYIGISFILTGAVVILKHLGFPLKQLSLLYLVTLPIAFKVFFGVLVDKIKTVFQGHYRGWLLIAQSGMFLLLVFISFSDIVNSFYLVLILFFIYAILTCVQDVAIDGLACKIFAKDERQKVNAVQYAGNLSGNIVGGGVILIFYEFLGWQGSLLLLAALTFLSLFLIIIYREPVVKVMPSSFNAEPIKLWTEFKRFWSAHKQWLFFLTLLPLGLSVAYALINPMLVDLNWTPQNIGFLTKIYGSIIGVFSALSIIPLMTMLGRAKALLSLMFLQSVVLIALIPLTQGYAGAIGIYVALGLYSLIQPALLATVSTVIMDKASVTTSKSTFFSLQLTIVVFMGFVYSALGIRIAHSYGYFVVMVGAIVVSFVVFGVLFILLKKSKKDGGDLLSET